MKEFVEHALLAAGLDPDVDRYVSYDKKMVRPAEVDLLVGDASKAKKLLDWAPKTSFQELVQLMVRSDLSLEL